MDNTMVFNLAQAAASLDGAMDGTDSGSAEWHLILEARQKVEQLIAYEVNFVWPTA